MSITQNLQQVHPQQANHKSGRHKLAITNNPQLVQPQQVDSNHKSERHILVFRKRVHRFDIRQAVDLHRSSLAHSRPFPIVQS